MDKKSHGNDTEFNHVVFSPSFHENEGFWVIPRPF